MMRTAVGRLGTKRQCPACGGKFYDLGRKPPTCSRCGAKVEPKKAKAAAKAAAPSSRLRRDRPCAASARARARPTPARRRDAAPPVGARDWSREQAAAIDRVGRWLKDGDEPVFRLFGYAGVGKTTLARHVAEARGRRGRLRRLHRQGGAGDARPRLRRRHHHPRADLSRQRGRRRRADLHPQRGRPGLAREPDRHRRVLDGRRGARRATSCRSASRSWCSAIPFQLPPVKGGGFFTEAEPDVMLTADPPPGGGQSDHPAVADRPLGRRARGRRLRREPGHPPRRDRRRAGAGRRPGAGRRQPDAARLQPAHSRARRLCRAAAARRRPAGLPAQRPDQGPDQRRPVAGRGARRGGQGFCPHDGALGGRRRARSRSRSRC